MSVGKQFVRIGEFAAAVGLWKIIIWLFIKPKRILILLIITFVGFYFIYNLTNYENEKFYVNINKLELFDKPNGNLVKTLEMNDTLIFLNEMSENWNKIVLEKDTFYFKEKYYSDEKLGYTSKIEETPFSAEKALIGQIIILNHPKGFIDTGEKIINNGDSVKVVKFSTIDSTITFNCGVGLDEKISIKNVKIEWESIYKSYPKMKR